MAGKTLRMNDERCGSADAAGLVVERNAIADTGIETPEAMNSVCIEHNGGSGRCITFQLPMIHLLDPLIREACLLIFDRAKTSMRSEQIDEVLITRFDVGQI